MPGMSLKDWLAGSAAVSQAQNKHQVHRTFVISRMIGDGAAKVMSGRKGVWTSVIVEHSNAVRPLQPAGEDITS